MTSTGSVRLVVRGDDFGMCHAVNLGIERAFRDGIVTTASTMAPCPWFGEAVRIANDNGIQLGVHQTLTCEWDYFRWRPVTGGRSLAGADGTFYPTVEEAQQHARYEEVVRELEAQVDQFASVWRRPDYLDHHMGPAHQDAYAEVSARFGVNYLYDDPVRRSLASISELSPRDAAGKKAWMLNYLRGLQPGAHVLITHPAVDSPELRSLTGPESVPYRWAAEYRVSDLEVLTDPEVKGLIEELGITLSTVADVTAPMP